MEFYYFSSARILLHAHISIKWTFKIILLRFSKNSFVFRIVINFLTFQWKFERNWTFHSKVISSYALVRLLLHATVCVYICTSEGYNTMSIFTTLQERSFKLFFNKKCYWHSYLLRCWNNILPEHSIYCYLHHAVVIK